MKKFEKWLGGLLAVQLIFAAALLWADQSAQENRSPQKLVEFQAAEVSRIQLEGEEESLLLERRQGQWVLPEKHNLPANQDQVERLLERVAALRGGWPVSTSENSHERFEVAEDKYQRRLRLYKDQHLIGELFVGTSPGLRQVHLRHAGQDEVYAGELPVYDIPVAPGDWLDKGLLAVNNITAVDGEGFRLEKRDDQWAFVESEAQVDQDRAAQLATTLTNLRVTGVADAAPEEVEEEVTLKVQADGQTRDYRFLKKGKDYYVGRSDLEPLFTWTSTSYEKLAGLDRESLTGTPPSEVAEKETESEKS